MRQRSYIRPVGIFVATTISTIAVFTFLKNHSAEESNRDSDVKFTSSIPSRPVARPPSVQLIQARPDDPVTAFLVEPRVQSRLCRVRGPSGCEATPAERVPGL
jgi:hypothetical protein